MDIKVFLSFRSEDTAGFAQALRDRLVLSFPKQVFLDNSSIPIGADLVKTIDAALRSCTVVVVIIGKNWQVDRDGRRRLKEPDDYVRLEVSTALRLKREVLPVLVHGAKMPRKDELPPNVLRLLRLKAARIDEGNWDYDVGKFIKSVEDLLAVPAEARALPAEARGRHSTKISAIPQQLLDQLHEKLEPLPKPTGSAPYHLALESVVPAATLQAIRRSGQMVIHMAGSSGGIRNPKPQRMVAREMRRQFQVRRPEDRPAFFYHLGDVVYFWGEPDHYYEQFYKPYEQYPAPIVAIPGNHDGSLGGGSVVSLDGFMRNFCAVRPQLTDEARDISRYAMTQPNPYWTLETPLATFVGLYTNIPEGGMLDTDQKRWLVSELKSAPIDRPLILATHHFVYSATGPRALGTGRQGSYLAQVLDSAEQHTGRYPDVVFSAHAVNYQRFTRHVAGREVPYIVAGAGGYPRLHRIKRQKNGEPVRVPQKLTDTDVTLQAYCDDRHGFVRLTLNRRLLRGEYFAVDSERGASSAEAELVDSFSLDLSRHRLC